MPRVLISVLKHFSLEAPRIVRADCGTENVVVAGLQRFFRSDAADDFSGDKSFLYGKSSANQVVDFYFFQSFS